MPRSCVFGVLCAHLLTGYLGIFGAVPISLHPENPHYFLWRSKPTILITSGEHYGAVLNLDFDYVKYLDALSEYDLNLTRTFAGGAYVEPSGAFGIARNTLAPSEGRFICPWARSDQPGYAGGGNKFDLDHWDEAYFKRLRDFVEHASRHGVVVEMNLFCPFYQETQWKLSPFNSGNNINGIGAVARANVYTLDRHGGLLAIEEKMVRRIVRELRGFDNVYYEICNEPYFGGVTMEWQRHIADVIIDAQNSSRPGSSAEERQLISLNVANGSAKVAEPHPGISIFNFHYATPPDTVALNYQLGKVIGDNETGFRGTNDSAYRMEGWDFILAGGGLFNNLDYSFTAGHEDGSFNYPQSQPGGGTKALRKQLRVLRDFIYGFDFAHMRPDNSVFKGGAPSGLSARALVLPGKSWAIYLRPSLVTPFSARWTGQIEPQFSDAYTFHMVSNGGARLWVNGRLVIDDWTEHGEQESTGVISLAAGKKYDLKAEYFHNGGMATVKLFWSSPHQAKEIVPSSQLWLPSDSGNGLRGEYFTGRNFDRPWQARDDKQINFSWGNRAPFAVPRHEGEVALELDLPAGSYHADWIDTLQGAVAKTEQFETPAGGRKLVAPNFSEDIALRVKRIAR